MMAKARKKPSARKLAQHKDEGERPGMVGRLFNKEKKNPARETDRAARPQAVAGEGTVIQSQASKLGVIVAWLVVSLVGLAAILALAMSARPTQAQAPAIDPGADATSQQAGDYAREFVATWLRADEDSEEELAAYESPSETDLSLRGAEPVEFRDLAVASVEEHDSGIITAYISAQLETVEVVDEEPAAEQDEEPETRTTWESAWYQVNVLPQDGDFSVLGYPAPVAAPDAASAPSLGYSDAAPDEVLAAVEDFFPAYMLEEGDVGWMTHPDSDIEPLTGHPYDQVTVTGVSVNEDIDDEVPEDGTTVKARAHLEIGQSEATHPATYSLTLQSRGGRWEIVAIDPAPELYVSNDGEMSTPTQSPENEHPGQTDEPEDQLAETESDDQGESGTEDPDDGDDDTGETDESDD